MHTKHNELQLSVESSFGSNITSEEIDGLQMLEE